MDGRVRRGRKRLKIIDDVKSRGYKTNKEVGLDKEMEIAEMSGTDRPSGRIPYDDNKTFADLVIS